MSSGNNPFTNLFSQQSGSGNANLFSNNNKSLFGPNSSSSIFGTNNNFNLFGNTLDNPNSNEKQENNKDINPFLTNHNKANNNDKDKDNTEKKNLGGSLFETGSSIFNKNMGSNNNFFFPNNDIPKTLFGDKSKKENENKGFGLSSEVNKNNEKKEEKKEGGFFDTSNNIFLKSSTDKSNNTLFGGNLFGEEDKKKEKNNENNNDFKFLTNNYEAETPMEGPDKEKKEEKDKIINNKDSFNPFASNRNEDQKKENNIFNVKNSLFVDNSIINNNTNTGLNINIIKTETISNNNVVDSNNNLEINNDINEQENINENEEKDMEVEEDIKQDSSSNNSDIINNLWISDNKEIIDDEIDVNKKIDYEILEELSKKKDNKINDINLLLLPELSEYYFNKSKSISDYYAMSDSNVKDKFSIEISRKIIEILSNILKEKNLEEKKESELINITTIYIYFDAFILHRNDVIYLMKLRDELLYRYYIPNETLINFEKKNNNIIYNKENHNINSIITTLKKIYFHLTMLDINKSYQQIGLLNQEYENIYRNKIFGDKTMKFKDLFMNMEKIIKIYNNIYSLKENFNSKQIISSFNMFSAFKEVKEIIREMEYDRDNMNENIKKIFIECQRISGILTGEINFLINDYNKRNIHLLIMANIFYRFYQNNFIKGINDCLKQQKDELNLENDLINKMIIKIIQNCDQNQIEIVQELKGDYPFLLRYHMIEILSQNAFLFQVENQENFMKKEAYILFENFKELKIPFKYYLNYLSFYPNYEIFLVENINDIDKMEDDVNDDLKENGYRKALDYALIYINSRFNECENIEEIKNEIDDIKNEIGNKIVDTYSNDVLYKINKLCLIKYNERNIYKYSILSYIENYNIENKDIKKLQTRQQRNQLCADNEINYEYPKQFDKVIINLYLNTNYIFNHKEFIEIYENNKEKIDQDYKDIQELLNILLNKKEQLSVDNEVQFIINYTQFLLDVIRYNFNIINKNKNEIDIVLSCKKFFGNCFPLPKCPTFIWYYILMIIKNVIDDNINQFSNDTFTGENDELCEDLSIWDKKLIYEIIKVEKIKGNEINFESANIMYENAISFINDITQGFYFNQCLYEN